MCGYFHDHEEDKEILRVIARTQGEPPVYYMRKWVDSSHWTAWEKVELNINSDHVLPVVWNNKRYLFWAIVTSKPDQHKQPVPPPVSKSEPPPNPRTHLEVQLAWSEFKQGKWQPAQTAPPAMVFHAPPNAWRSLRGTLQGIRIHRRAVEVRGKRFTARNRGLPGRGQRHRRNATRSGEEETA